MGDSDATYYIAFLLISRWETNPWGTRTSQVLVRGLGWEPPLGFLILTVRTSVTRETWASLIQDVGHKDQGPAGREAVGLTASWDQGYFFMSLLFLSSSFGRTIATFNLPKGK